MDEPEIVQRKSKKIVGYYKFERRLKMACFTTQLLPRFIVAFFLLGCSCPHAQLFYSPTQDGYMVVHVLNCYFLALNIGSKEAVLNIAFYFGASKLKINLILFVKY